MLLSTSITHTINVVEQGTRSYWGSSSERCVTKYVIRVQLGDGIHWHVSRRYSHFRSNHAALSSMFAALKLPRLPPKSMSMEQLSSSKALQPPDPEIVASRMVLLNSYLKALLADRTVASCTQMRTFLGAYQGMQLTWFADVQRSVSDDQLSQPDTDAFAALTFSSSSKRRSADGATPPPPPPAPAAVAGNGTPAAAADTAPSKDPPPLEHYVPYARSDARAAKLLIDHLDMPLNVEAFAAEFDTLHFRSTPDGATSMVHRFLNCMEAAVAVSHPERAHSISAIAASPPSPGKASGNGNGCAEGVLWCARDLLEDQLLLALHDRVFAALPGDDDRDALLHSRLEALSSVLTSPDQLDVGAIFCDTRFNRWDAAISELLRLGSVRTPRAKMDCVMRSVLQLKQGLLECLAAQGVRGHLGADELFPVLIYTVLCAKPPRLASTLAYVQRFRSPMALKSEAGCYFTHLQAAVSFLESLAIEHEEKAAAEAAEGATQMEPSASPAGAAGSADAPTLANESGGGGDCAVDIGDGNGVGAIAPAATPATTAAPATTASGTEPVTPAAATQAPDGASPLDPPLWTWSARRGVAERVEGDGWKDSRAGETRIGDSTDVSTPPADADVTSPWSSPPARISRSLSDPPSFSRSSPSEPPTFSREALAQQRAEQVENAASNWEKQIESLIGSQRPSEHPSEGGVMSRQQSDVESSIETHPEALAEALAEAE